MSDCEHNCSSCGTSGCGQRTAPEKAQLNQYSKVKKVYAVISGKGGVGKSLITSLMAVAMQKKGYQTGIIDADITGPSIPKSFGVSEVPGVYDERLIPASAQNGTRLVSLNLLLEHETDPVLWRSPIITGTVKQFWSEVIWEDIDYMFVDMPPGTGDVPMTVLQSFPIDGIIIVSSPQELVGMIVEKAVKMAQMFEVPVIGLVQNMAYFECPNCKEKHRIFGESHINQIADLYGIDTVCEIPMDMMVASKVDHGTVYDIDPVWLADLVEKISL